MELKIFKNIFIILIVLGILAVVFSKVFKNKSVQKNELNVQIEQQNINQKEINSKKIEKPNALDYMAPGYNETNEKLQEVKNIRQKSLDIQNTNINSIETD